MLKRINGKVEIAELGVKISDAAFPVPFSAGLEYSAPARGMWNIVHTGMLIPEAHEIFVCAAGCLRGVVLTAAEMGAQERFSTIEIREQNLLDGTMEELIIEGVRDIISHIEKRPPAILLYTSCIHHFTGCDMDMVFDRLRTEFVDIDFTDCYMNPIMRKSGLTPDAMMRKQLYSLLKMRKKDNLSVNIIGSDLAVDRTSELVTVVEGCGFRLREITACKSYNEYLLMAESVINITCYPSAYEAGEELEKRLGQKHIHLPVSFDLDKIEQMINELEVLLGGKKNDHSDKKMRCRERLKKLLNKIGDIKIAIDYTAVSQPFELAELLIKEGFNVYAVFADSVSGADKAAFERLKGECPTLMLYPTVHPGMRVIERDRKDKILAIGQKAAYFLGTQNFVNIVEDGGHWGYDGILRLSDEIEDALCTEKDARKLIQIKGWGCGCC